MAEFAQKRANSAITTLALGAKLCKAHTCNIFAQGKFDANSFFRPVLYGHHEDKILASKETRTDKNSTK